MLWNLILLSVAAGALALAAWLAVERRRLRAAHAEAVDRAESAGRAEAGALRLLRLSAQELRAIGVRVHGHAGLARAAVAAADSPGLADGLQAAAAQLLDIADALQDRAQPTQGPRLLREEVLNLAQEVGEAVSQAQMLLGPGRRNWRLPQPAPPTWLWADRRAVRHVLGRVLADAVRNTGHEDWIEIALRPHPEGLELVVEDEGMGIATTAALVASEGACADALADSRGIGLRLALARSLMEAHGGRLEVEAMPRVGSRVCLVFPLARRREADAAMAVD